MPFPFGGPDLAFWGRRLFGGDLPLLFALGFLLASCGGAYVRISGSLRGFSNRSFPWSAGAEPGFDTALDWILLQERLLELG